MKIEEFKSLLKKDYALEDIDLIIEGLQKKRLVSFRVNTLKSNNLKIEEILNQKGIEYQKIPWYNDAYLILNKEVKDLQVLDIYQDGEIYLQSLSSMIPVLVLDPKEEESILDCAAAPGSKTSQIAALTNNKGIITAVEKNKIRASRLIYNLNKLGVKKTVVLQEDARYLSDAFSFDKILVDAPCSGSGTIYINDNLPNTFTNELINNVLSIQEGMLRKALSLLKKDQILVYSTCSILKDENERLVLKVIKDYKVEIVPILKEKFGDVKFLPSLIEGAITVMPNQIYEGFFVIKLRKVG